MIEYLRSHKILIIESVIFLFISLSFIIPNGQYVCNNGICELHIGDWHMHDALWHISLAKLGFSTWPLSNPFMSGTSLIGYNFLLDYILYLLTQIGISPIFSFFQILPTISSLIYIVSVLWYVSHKKMAYVKSLIYAFFLYFASSFSYLATLYANGTFIGSTLRGFPVISTISPSTMFLNLQFSFSLSIILWILILLDSKPHMTKSLIIGLLYFLLFGFKFYGAIIGILIYALLLLSSIFKVGISKQKVFEAISVFIFSLFGLYVYYGLGSNQSSPFVFAPFALTHLFIDDPLLFYNHGLTLARYFLYENKLGISPRLIAIELLSIFLFIIFNFGTRILSVLYVFNASIQKRLSREHMIFFVITILTFLIPIFYIQEGGWYNTMQFLYYGLWLASFLSAEYCFQLYDSKLKLKYIFLLSIFLLTIPNVIDQLRYIHAPQIVISNDELKALEVLKSAPSGVVHINNPVHRNGYIPALAEKVPFYLDTDQLMVTRAPYQDRLNFINKYQGGSITTIPADYFYIYKSEWGTGDAITALSNPSFKLIYDSADISIYQRLQSEMLQ